MKKKFGIAVVTALFTVSALMPVAPAMANGNGNGNGNNENGVTQGELALLLVNVLGLYRFLPAAPSEQQAIGVLIANRIAPANGWEPGKPVVLADLAQVIVRALDRADEVRNPEDPRSWINFLASIGVPIDTVGLALSHIEPLAEPIAANVYAATVSTDPLLRRSVFGQPDEMDAGVDVAFLVSQRPLTLSEVVDVVRVVPPPAPPKPKPSTP